MQAISCWNVRIIEIISAILRRQHNPQLWMCNTLGQGICDASILYSSDNTFIVFNVRLSIQSFVYIRRTLCMKRFASMWFLPIFFHAKKRSVQFFLLPSTTLWYCCSTRSADLKAHTRSGALKLSLQVFVVYVFACSATFLGSILGLGIQFNDGSHTWLWFFRSCKLGLSRLVYATVIRWKEPLSHASPIEKPTCHTLHSFFQAWWYVLPQWFAQCYFLASFFDEGACVSQTTLDRNLRFHVSLCVFCLARSWYWVWCVRTGGSLGWSRVPGNAAKTAGCGYPCEWPHTPGENFIYHIWSKVYSFSAWVCCFYDLMHITFWRTLWYIPFACIFWMRPWTELFHSERHNLQRNDA